VEPPPAAPHRTVSAHNFSRPARYVFPLLGLVLGGIIIYNFFEGGAFSREYTGMAYLETLTRRDRVFHLKDASGQLYFGHGITWSMRGDPGYEEIEGTFLYYLREPSLWAARQSPGFEAYRFTYLPSFHSKVCICAWKESATATPRIRSSALVRFAQSETVDSDLSWFATDTDIRHFYRKERSLNSFAWSRLQGTFRDREVRYPPGGWTFDQGLDGSHWVMEWVVDGQYGRAHGWSPGSRHRRWNTVTQARPRSAKYEPFFNAGLQMLKTARVQVDPIY